MSPNSITWVGMDAHKNSIKVAALCPEPAESVEWTEDTTPEAIRRLARKLQRLAPGEVRSCYEAGPTGYGLQRQLRAAGVACTGHRPIADPDPAGGPDQDRPSRRPQAGRAVPGGALDRGASAQ